MSNCAQKIFAARFVLQGERKYTLTFPPRTGRSTTLEEYLLLWSLCPAAIPWTMHSLPRTMLWKGQRSLLRRPSSIEQCCSTRKATRVCSTVRPVLTPRSSVQSYPAKMDLESRATIKQSTYARQCADKQVIPRAMFGHLEHWQSYWTSTCNPAK